MKNKLILLCCLTLTGLNTLVLGRDRIKLKEIKTETLSVGVFEPAKRIRPDLKRVFLEVNFGDYEINNKKAIDSLEGATIKSISLVYTKYPIHEDLTRLNKHRFEYLQELCPKILDNPATKCKIVAQTNCKDEETARKLFHGFVIIYSAESIVPIQDSSVLKAFERNQWKNVTVVSDFTGSMAPYIRQVYIWYNLTYATKDINEFVFFNDGDRTPDNLKRDGYTGGIYYSKGTIKDSMYHAAFRCKNNGNGGDIEENNIEAILFAIKKNPKLKEVIMIADNNADMRDYEMMDKIKIPVHIILCGLQAHAPINTEYLNLARSTKGSIHTIEKDIAELQNVLDGKSIIIDGYDYKVKNGKFVKPKKV